MPTQSTRAAMTARGWGRSAGYVKPPMVDQNNPGGQGVITPNAAGYLFSNWEGNSEFNHNGYLNVPLTVGTWYWELLITAVASAGGSMDVGVKDGTITDNGDARWSGANGGGGNAQVQFSTVGGTWAGAAGGGAVGVLPVPGDVIGIALDLNSATRTFKAYKNNVLKGTLSWTQAGLILYPVVRGAIGQPGRMAAQLRLGHGACSYGVVGYQYL